METTGDIIISWLKGHQGVCRTLRANNAAGQLWERLYRYIGNGKFMAKTCASGCFVGWDTMTEAECVKDIEETRKTINEIPW